MGRGTVFQPNFFISNQALTMAVGCWHVTTCLTRFSFTCLSCDMGRGTVFQPNFMFSNQTLTMGCWHVMTCLTWYRLHAYHVTWGCTGAVFGKLLGWLPTGFGAVTSQHP